MSNVADALAELRDLLGTLMQDRWGGALASLVARTVDVRAKYRAHIANTGGAWHSTADTVNVISMIDPVTREQAYLVLNQIRARMAAHLATAGAVHAIADGVNVITSPEADDIDSGVALANELADVLDAHRDEAGVHALDDTANVITSDPAHAGTIERPVDIGDRHLNENYTGGPRVVMALTGSTSSGPRDMCTNPKTISEDRYLIEVHAWVAESEAQSDYEVRDIDRIRDAVDLHEDVKRAVYMLQHGALGVRTEAFTDVTMVRDTELLRYGEEFIDLFIIPKPVPLGPTYQLALGTPTADTGHDAGLVINPPA